MPSVRPRLDAAPTPTPTSHLGCPHARFRSPASDRVRPPATHPAPATASGRPRPILRLDPIPAAPRRQACRTTSPRHAALLPSPRCHPPAAPRPPPRSVSVTPLPRPNVSSLQHPSNSCNICNILLKHTYIQHVRLLVNDRKFPAGNSVFLSHQTSQQ